MPPPNNNGFIVVECQTAPNNNNRCVCVPRSWVKCELRENKVAIAYPAEDENRIASRISNKEPASETWSLYIGEIKYEADSYEDAVVGFLKKNAKQTEEKSSKKSDEDAEQKKNAKEIEEQNYKKSNEIVLGSIKKKVEEEVCRSEYFCGDAGPIPKDSLKVRIVLPKRSIKPDKKSKSKSLKKYLKEHSKNKIHKYKHKNEEQRALKENTVRRKKDSTSDSGDSGVVEGSSRFEPKSSENSSEKSLEAKVDDLIVDSLRQTLKELNDNSGKSQKISQSLDIEQESEIDLTNSNLSPEDKRAVLMIHINQRQTRGYIKSVLVHMRTLYLKYIEDKKTLNEIILKSKNQPQPTVSEKTLAQINENEFEEENSDDMETLRFDDDGNSDDEEKSATQEDCTSIDEQQNLLEEMDTQMDDQDCDFETCMDDEELKVSSENSCPEPVKPKRRIKIDKYSVNSTWSLKHPEPGNGLVPFGKSNQVYISAKGFEQVKKRSTSPKMCARLLCREIFKPKALRTCSMTGKRGYFGYNTEFVRPPIHSGALNDIISYSMSFGAKMGNYIERHILVRSIRSLLQNSRRVMKK